ncbi:MAG: DUF4149 domain-containing protein [Burkholderiales bacterium]|nr:DUF4149 domain-containing protein [Burkholderiales bacterium]
MARATVTTLDCWRTLLPAFWAGGLVAVAAIATPAPFATLAVADAGRVVARVLAQEAHASLVLGVALLLLERQAAKRGAGGGAGTQFSGGMVLALAAIFCTVLGYFALQPLMPAARAGQGAFSFAQLHMASALCYGLKTLAVLALAWRNVAAAVVGAREASAGAPTPPPVTPASS